MVELYDGALAFIGPAGRAVRHGYTKKLNELPQATLELAVADPLNAAIIPGVTFARYTDRGRFVGTYRVASATIGHEPKGIARYILDGAECTLLDDMLSGWHEIGGTGMPTVEVLQYILDRQTTHRWHVGRCDFHDYYQYNFEDVTLLEAIMSLGEVLTDPYEIQFDTESNPWSVNIVRLGTEPRHSLVYHRNTQKVRRSIDGTVVTRLVGRGYGEGDNQLTIASVNDGKDYIDADPAAMAAYGVRMGVHVDTRQTDPETLKAQMERILAAGSRPQVTYEVTAYDLAQETGEREDDMALGEVVRVIDETMPEIVSCRITEIEKADIDGSPGDIRVVLDTGGGDTAEQLNEVLEKIGVQQLYSQGATSMYALRAAENADESHPMELEFYVPGNVLRINSCRLKYKISPYRVDFTMAAHGGGSTQTSASGGGISTTIPAYSITSDFATSEAKRSSDLMPITQIAEAADGNGIHTHNVTDHLHTAKHVIQIPAQTLKVDPHSHQVTIPSHTHQLTYGIATGGGTASSITITVDGSIVDSEDREIEIAPYLNKDDDGRITRGQWHTIQITPDGNARITANLFVQQFLQSRGGGDY